MSPTLAVAGIAFDQEGRVLLIRRSREPRRGVWTVPGGRVEHGERLVDALRREFREELSLEIDVGPLVCAFEIVGEQHYVILDYLVRAHSTEVVAGDDAAEARWVARDQLAALETTDGLLPVLEQAWRLRS